MAGTCSSAEPERKTNNILPNNQLTTAELPYKTGIGKYILIDNTAKHKKGIAIVLAIALGPFGAHRLYLGAPPKIPVMYTITLGGGLGLLPLADIIAMTLTSDIEKYADNSKVIMWIQ